MLHTCFLSLMTWYQMALPCAAMATTANKADVQFHWVLHSGNRHFAYKGTFLIRYKMTLSHEVLSQHRGASCGRNGVWASFVPMNSKLMSTKHAGTHSSEVAVGATEPSKPQVMLDVNIQSTPMGKMFIAYMARKRLFTRMCVHMQFHVGLAD